MSNKKNKAVNKKNNEKLTTTSKIEYLNNIYKSSIFALIIIFITIWKMSGLLNFLGNEFKQHVVVIAIFLYYTILVLKSMLNKSYEAFKSTVCSFFYIFAIYNGLVALNPLKMEEISSKYTVGNNLYLLISFIFTTANYYIYNIFGIITNILFKLYYTLRIKTINFLVLVNILAFLLYLPMVNFTMAFYGKSHFKAFTIGYIITMASIMILFMIFNKLSNVAIVDKLYIKIKNSDNLTGLKQSFDSFLDKAFTVFGLKKLDNFKFIKEDGTLSYINTFIISSCKIYPLFLFIVLFSSNLYYSMYSIDYKDTCSNLKDQSISKIIELNNGDVLIEEFVTNGKIYRTESCTREKKIIKAEFN